MERFYSNEGSISQGLLSPYTQHCRARKLPNCSLSCVQMCSHCAPRLHPIWTHFLPLLVKELGNPVDLLLLVSPHTSNAGAHLLSSSSLQRPSALFPLPRSSAGPSTHAEVPYEFQGPPQILSHSLFLLKPQQKVTILPLTSTHFPVSPSCGVSLFLPCIVVLMNVPSSEERAFLWFMCCISFAWVLDLVTV